MDSCNVLVTAASRRVPLVQAFQQALRALGVDGRVIVTDVNSLSPAVHVADRWYLVPMSEAPDYIDAILAICEEERIGLVVPTIDDELAVFGRARAAFSERGIRVAVSSPDTSDRCHDKLACCRFLREQGVAAARTVLPHELTGAPTFPLFIKPRRGRGGVEAYPVRSARELEFFRDYVGDPVIQEFLDGPEFTIDVLCNFEGVPLSIVPRERTVVRAGVIDRGRTVRDPRLISLARDVTRVMRFAGPLNVQCRMPADRPIVFEINPRFSGGIPLTIAAGAHFPKMLLELALGRRVPAAIGSFREQLWMTNFESSLFVDASRLRTAGLTSPVRVGVGADERL